jgi:glucose-1-phosphate thymidylyltransferase
MRVVILAAGYGTRLYPLTVSTPKPLIPLSGKPIINFLVEKIEALRLKHGIEDILIVSNNRFYKNFLEWKKDYEINVNIINDGTNSPEDRLGAVKDIKLAIGKKSGDWLVVGGDNIFEDDLDKFLTTAKANAPFVTIGLHDVKSKQKAREFGVVKLAKDNIITRMQEKPRNPFSTLAASCVYFFPFDSMIMLEDFLESNAKADASGQYIAWLVENTKVYGYTLKGSWFDIGCKDSLESAQKHFLPDEVKIKIMEK